jgi:hypothetical protein
MNCDRSGALDADNQYDVFQESLIDQLTSSGKTLYWDRILFKNFRIFLRYTGTTGAAAAAAIMSSRQTSRNTHSFETNPVTRKRLQTRLLRSVTPSIAFCLSLNACHIVDPIKRKLKELADEVAAKCGQQVCFMCCGSVKSSKSGLKIFGTTPLEEIVGNFWVRAQRRLILTN